MIQALIFDMDDLLVSSAPVWRFAEEILLRAVDQLWTPALASQYKGMNALDVARVIHETYKPAWPLAESQRILRDALIAKFTGNVQPMPGAVELINRVSGRAPIAVASGSPLAAIDYAMTSLDIRQHFTRIISSEQVTHGKPHPDVFLAAAEALGVAPTECLVFEDSLIGVRAARAAGMNCFAVNKPQVEIAQLATRMFQSLAEISLSDIFPD
jgi:HAD superfamily hydrolase (TIGR01509 family)